MGGVRVEIQVSRRELHTHIHLHYVKVKKFILYIKNNNNIKIKCGSNSMLPKFVIRFKVKLPRKLYQKELIVVKLYQLFK